MIKFLQGNIFNADTQALINTVNTKGFMGKGLALEVKKRFPLAFELYKKACTTGDIQVGQVQVVDLASIANPRYIINFPTKKDWRHPSKIEYIDAGLTALIDVINQYQIKSVAIPPLGCGNGHLEWQDVKKLISARLEGLKDVNILIYEPKSDIPSPRMTSSRASVLRLLENYCTFDFELTLLEVHKLLYFLQEFGEPLNLKFAKNIYGPYANNLGIVLNEFDTHFLKMGSSSEAPMTSVSLLPDGVFKAEEFELDPISKARLDKVLKFVSGFQSAYAIELLATVHWLIKHEGINIDSIDDIMTAIKGWSDRKTKSMQRRHVEVATARVKEFM